MLAFRGSAGVIAKAPMEDLVARVERLKRALDALRPVPLPSLWRLRRWFDVDLTYTSNAIEGNTLTAVETELVIDKGITIAGKPLKDHLEALDHYDAIGLARDLARSGRSPTEADIRALHALVLRRSRPAAAGRYADEGRFVRTDERRHAFPPPAEVPALMQPFGLWLSESADSPDTAFEAHRRLVAIHPFNDGNGRTARLLMNLLLIRAGYPPISIRPEDRLAYIRSLAEDQAGRGDAAFRRLMLERLEATLEEYLELFREAADQATGGVSEDGGRWSDA